MIFGYIKGQTLELHYDKIVSESVDYLTAEFNFFTNEWEGFTKWAHFKKSDQVFGVLLEDNKINKNAHLNLSAGEWGVYLHGNSDTGERITTNVVHIKVEPTGVLNGEPLPEIPLSAAEQITALAQRAVEVAESVRTDADNGVFDGEQGDDYILTEHDREEIAKKATSEIREELKDKADLIDGKVPLEQLPDDIGDGNTLSWNDIEDRPFGYTGTVIKWNGNTDGLETLTITNRNAAFTFYKVSDKTFTEDDLNGGAFTADGSETNLSTNSPVNIIPINNGISNNAGNPSATKYIVVNKEGTLSFPNPNITSTYATMGTYFATGVTELRTKGTIKQLEGKFIPDNIARTADLENKADLVGGKIPVEQIPVDEILNSLPEWNGGAY